MRLLLACLLFVPIFQPLAVFGDLGTSTSFRMERTVIDAGGGRGTSTSFSGESSIGQAGTGISSSTSFILRGGFLYLGEPVLLPPSSPTPPTSPPASPSGGSNSGGGSGGVYPLTLPKEKPLSPEVVTAILKHCDFNGDGRCDIVDFSILLYYYGRTGSAIARYDLSNNGRVDFYDVSVIMYYWSSL